MRSQIQTVDVHERKEFPDATVATIIAEHVAIRPESPAIVPSKGNVLTYGALGAQIAAFGAGLRANGIAPSARVAIMLPDGLELAVAIVAVACHAVAVPLNPKTTATEILSLFTRLHIDAIVTSNKIDTAARSVAARLGTPLFELASDGAGGFKILAAVTSAVPNSETALRGDASPNAPAVILQTSATAGRPKLVPVTHRNLVVSACRRRYWFNITPNDRALSEMPLYYAQGLKAGLLTPLLVGASVVCRDHEADGDIIDRLRDLRPTWYDAAGQVFHMTVLECARKRQGAPLRHCLRFISSVGLSVAVRQGLEEVFGVPVLERYGLSEAGTVAANSVVPEHRKAGTMGKPWPNEVAIRAEDGRLLPPGAAGEIVVRGPVLMPGYLDDEEANDAAFVDGWFRTGDLGLIDAEGFLTVLGRLKEFINRGSEKISPYEIEQALLLHPSVREAAAFSVPHPRMGENVAAAVVLMSGANTTSTEIKVFLSDHLAPFKIPQHVFVKAELPKGATGKTLRRKLSEEAAHRIREITPAGETLELQILQVWQRLIGRDDIGVDDDFLEVGGDSLLATEMLCEVEAITRQQIPPSELRAVYTVRELAAAVLRSNPTTAELVSCAKPGRGTPFMFCHGDFTSRGFYALKLAEMLRGDQPVFLVHADPPDTQLGIEEMARSRMPQILAAHPAGAFRLGGHCNGGLLAWEIARHLERLDREIEFIVLIDAPSVNARPIFRAIAQLNRFIVAIAPRKISRKFALDGMRAIWSRRNFSYGSSYSRAVSNYVPQKIRSRVICLISEESRSRMRYSWKPWINLADEVSCQYIAGTHLGCITEHVGGVARVLDSLLLQP
jgi:oxalate---CoA ligase